MNLEEKVELLTDCVLNDSEFSKLALSYEWDSETRSKIFDIMDKYFLDKSQSYTYKDIEKDFETILGFNYQDLKPLFLCFFNEGRFINVLKKYLETNYKDFENVSCEYNDMYTKLFNE